MPKKLSEEQRDQVRKTLEPLIKEALESSVTPILEEKIRDEIEGLGLKEANEEYVNKILDKRDRRQMSEGDDNGFGVARIARCIALANNDREKAAHVAGKLYDDDLGDMVVKVLSEEKALSSGDTDEGGVFVPEMLAQSFIDKLRARAVVRAAGPVEVDLTGGNLRVPRITTDPSAGWVGEGKKRNTSNLRTGNLNFTAKTLQGKSSTTQALLRRSGQSVETIVRDGLIRVMANEEDKAFLAGVGSENSPRGILNWVAAGNKFNAAQAGAAATLSEVQADFTSQLSDLTDNDVDITQAVYFMSHRSRNFLAFTLRDTEDTPVFKAELTAPTPMLNGQRAFFTNNIPNNLGGGNDESRIYLVAMQEAWVADEAGLTIRASMEASFTDENGNLISAFDQGLMAIIIERNTDFALAHDVGASVMEQVKYGA